MVNTSHISILLIFLLIIIITTTTTATCHTDNTAITTTCTAIHRHNSTISTCNYVKSTTGCDPKGYINYLQLYYCNFSQFPKLGFLILLFFLFILFYVLSNTASDYFCPAVEHLSNSLNLSPAIAGTTLLPLGNGSTDVFSSVIAFTTTADGGDIGVNSVLGGSIFVSTVVVGVLSLLIGYRRKVVVIDKPNFIRDVVFLLVTLTNLLVIIIIGEINLFASICFVSTYVIYILLVCYMHFVTKNKHNTVVDFPHDNGNHDDDVITVSIDEENVVVPCDDDVITVPLLSLVEEKVVHPAEKVVRCEEKVVPYSNKRCVDDDDVITAPLLCFVDEENVVHPVVVRCEEKVVPYNKRMWIVKFMLYVIKLPVYLPRRVTIPVVTKERWSKPFLVISMILAPIMLAIVWNTKEGKLGLKASMVTYFVVGSIGIALGICTYGLTSSTAPPQRCLVFWYASGFLMSVTWTYVTCNELVSLLESLGNIIGMNPAIIGLTILAWGNSIGDLAANVALAMYGGPDGPQIAMSGCYAGPLFNVLIGLGFSFVFVSWSKYPAAYVIPEDPNLCETIGFLMVGLLWALVILPKREMRVDHTLGSGLLVIYLCFLFIKLARAIGLLG